MEETITIVCLANSRKHSGRCIAGKTAEDACRSRWIRAVSGRPTAEISNGERAYENGLPVRLLDLVEIPIAGARPRGFQTENQLIRVGQWVKKGRIELSEVGYFADEPSCLWVDGYSTYHGLNDRVPAEIANRLRSSLTLVRTANLFIRVLREGYPKARVRAGFDYLGSHYDLPVTDPIVEKKFSRKAEGSYRTGDAYLCVSLGEEYADGFCYKLVAAIFGKMG